MSLNERVVNLKRLFYLSTNICGFIPKYVNMINWKGYVFPLSHAFLFLAYSYLKYCTKRGDGSFCPEDNSILSGFV